MAEGNPAGLWWAWKAGSEDAGAVIVQAPDREMAEVKAAGALGIATRDDGAVVLEVCNPFEMQETLQKRGQMLGEAADLIDKMLNERQIDKVALDWSETLRKEAEAERNALKATMERLGLHVREDTERPTGQPRFTAHIPGAGRGDGHTPEEAIDKLRERLIENAGPRERPEKQTMVDAMTERAALGLTGVSRVTCGTCGNRAASEITGPAGWIPGPTPERWTCPACQN